MCKTTDKPMIRVLMVDDHPAVRQGVAQLLAAGHHVMAGEAESRQEALRRLQQDDIDLILLDLSLEGESGFELLTDLGTGAIPIVVYSMHETPDIIERTLRAGASGYVTKREKPKVLLEAVRAVVAGQRFLSPKAAQRLAEGAGTSSPIRLEQNLSEREYQILQRLGCGDTRQEIAIALGLSARTVETYCARLINKLGLTSTSALRKYAITLQRTPVNQM